MSEERCPLCGQFVSEQDVGRDIHIERKHPDWHRTRTAYQEAANAIWPTTSFAREREAARSTLVRR